MRIAVAGTGYVGLSMAVLLSKGIEVVIGEPTMRDDTFFNSRIIRDFTEFKIVCDIIMRNRYNEEIEDILEIK